VSETEVNPPPRFDRASLEKAGFEGFVPLLTLDSGTVPTAPGVYCVVRVSVDPPSFLATSPAGRFKGKDPTVSSGRLEAKWIRDTPVLYIGKASDRRGSQGALRKRLDEYRRHGVGQPVGHWGGRFIWQLEDAAELLICWRTSKEVEAEDVEAAMLAAFVANYGGLPFANLKRGRRGTSAGIAH